MAGPRQRVHPDRVSGLTDDDRRSQQAEVDAEVASSAAEMRRRDEERGQHRRRDWRLAKREAEIDERQAERNRQEQALNERDRQSDERDRQADQREINGEIDPWPLCWAITSHRGRKARRTRPALWGRGYGPGAGD